MRGVTLTVADGELLVLFGASGSGKTTLLRLIAGLEAPTSGSIEVGGQVVVPGSGHRLNVAMCFQSPALYPHLRIRENLVFGWRVRYNWFSSLFGRREPPGLERQVLEIASLLDLVPLLDRKPAELSGGERQRVALGRAMLRQPAVLLLDEPLAHVDGPLRDRLRQALKSWHHEHGATVVWVTHDPEEALAVGDRLGVLHLGELQQVGPPDEVYARPATVKVAERIGHPPWNLLPGQLVQRDGNVGLASDQEFIAIPCEASDGLGTHMNRAMHLGLRSEAIRVSCESSPSGALSMVVELVESAGSGRWAVLRQGNWRLKCEAQDAALAVGERVAVQWDWRQARWFDGDQAVALPVARTSAEA